MDSSSSQFGGCGHTCVNSSNGYKGEIKRKLYPTRDGRKVIRPPLVRLASERFFRARSGPGPYSIQNAGPQRKLHCLPPPEKQNVRESKLNIHT
ncbi:hypothetical protein Ahy_B02g060747 [Arachis hypogaea]|uniref:Uncharacterized protein n=1 Tax=Arachis hypogaea TaxID=3818 RepID=A0A445AJ82_ARAHY|nr:hypothetical protein Ahy_B02g060747 [Arachis hypogaea]